VCSFCLFTFTWTSAGVMASEPSHSHLLLKSSCLQDDAVRRLRRNAPTTFGSSQALLSSRARLGRHHTSPSLFERSGAVCNSSTALLGDGPSYPFHAGADSYRLRSGAYRGFTTKQNLRTLTKWCQRSRRSPASQCYTLMVDAVRFPPTEFVCISWRQAPSMQSEESLPPWDRRSPLSF